MEVFHIIPFDERKMMSVIYQDPTTRSLILSVKGADSSVIPISTNKNATIINQINNFSKSGYRTLVFAEKQISEQQANSLKTEIARLKQRRLSREINRDQYI